MCDITAVHYLARPFMRGADSFGFLSTIRGQSLRYSLTSWPSARFARSGSRLARTFCSSSAGSEGIFGKTKATRAEPGMLRSNFRTNSTCEGTKRQKGGISTLQDVRVQPLCL